MCIVFMCKITPPRNFMIFIKYYMLCCCLNVVFILNCGNDAQFVETYGRASQPSCDPQQFHLED